VNDRLVNHITSLFILFYYLAKLSFQYVRSIILSRSLTIGIKLYLNIILYDLKNLKGNNSSNFQETERRKVSTNNVF
jgi:hypothetical protein